MSNKDKKNQTSFKPGNKDAEKYTFETAKDLFENIFYNAKNNEDILCLQDAYTEINMRSSTFYYLLEKFPDLEFYKKDIENMIIRRINKMALKNKFNSTASIWRMKQLGERDQQYQDLTTGGKPIEQKTEVIFKNARLKNTEDEKEND